MKMGINPTLESNHQSHHAVARTVQQTLAGAAGSAEQSMQHSTRPPCHWCVGEMRTLRSVGCVVRQRLPQRDPTREVSRHGEVV